MKNIYLLSCAPADEGGGVYAYGFTREEAVQLGYLPLDRPMYAVMEGGRLHILLREPFPGSRNSGYLSCRPDFSDPTAPQDTQGVCACHLAVDDGDVYTVNYLSGNLSKNCRECVTHCGEGKNPVRQEAPHTHFVGFLPGRKHLLCTDLGLDTVFVYDRALHETGRATVPAGSGVRHLVLSPDGKRLYAVNELNPSVTLFGVKGEQPFYIGTTPLPCTCEASTAAAIRISPDGGRLYVSIRGENVIDTLASGKDLPVPIGRISCGGKGPRDFVLLDAVTVLCCNEDSDSVTVVDLETGKVLQTVSMKHPLCCVESQTENGK